MTQDENLYDNVRLLCLNNHEIISLDEFSSTGLSVIYAPMMELAGVEEPLYLTLMKWSKKTLHRFTELPITGAFWRPENSSIYSLQSITHAVSFFSQIRELAVEGYFADNSIVMLAPAMAWDIYKDRALLSVIPHGAVHEYLLWNAASLDKAETWERHESTRLAWTGAGWSGRRMENFLTGNKPEENITYPMPTGWKAQVRAALERLKESLRQLETLRRSDQLIPSSFNPWALQSYRRALCDFLPPYPHAKLGVDIPSNIHALPGGPILWKNTLLDGELDMHKRHLLLDGWLIPWQCGDELYIQPASLALLYWAAHEERLPHTGCPKDFIDKYRWENDKHWFGGHWPDAADKADDAGKGNQ